MNTFFQQGLVNLIQQN